MCPDSHNLLNSLFLRQDSVLGPLLFTMLADDNKLYYSFPNNNLNNALRNVNKDLTSIASISADHYRLFYQKT